MISLTNVSMVHVEASSRCNSHCPMCSRFTSDGHLQPGLIENDLQPEVFYKLFTVDFTKQLQHVYFSGVYGDPCLNKRLPEYVSYLRNNGCESVSIDTNGGYRNEDWWASLAMPGVMINFAVDGTTNSTLGKYRIGVNFDKVLANMTSYVSNGGQAQWNFIVFKHNEHEVEIAKNMAKKLGINFRIKLTQKFRHRRNHKVMKNGEFLYTIEPPDNTTYRHTNVGTEDHVPVTIFKFDLKNYAALDKNIVNCKSQIRKEIYLSASGLLLPCCYLGTYTHDSPGSYQFNHEYNMRDFNLHNNTVDEIISRFVLISSKWNDTVENGNLITCLQTCGNIENTTLYVTDDVKYINQQVK